MTSRRRFKVPFAAAWVRATQAAKTKDLLLEEGVA